MRNELYIIQHAVRTTVVQYCYIVIHNYTSRGAEYAQILFCYAQCAQFLVFSILIVYAYMSHCRLKYDIIIYCYLVIPNVLSVCQYKNREGVLLSIADIGLRQYQSQDGFESVMAWGMPWQQWKVPICIAYDGLFIHEEIETAA